MTTAHSRPLQRPDNSDDPRIAHVLQEYEAALEAGQRPDRRAFLARHPDLAECLAGYLDGLDFLHAAAVQLDAPAAASPLAEVPPTGLGELGDFRLLREVGRGGMGIVYEAEQISLGRRVALKVLPFAATMDPRQRQRFHNEARAAASLHHPHIVPVHAVGVERGVHFYAMQFIDGQSLEGLVRDLRESGSGALPPVGRGRGASIDSTTDEPPPVPDTRDGPLVSAAVETVGDAQGFSTTSTPLKDPEDLRRVVGWGIQAAEALEHAHSLGIVHRDVKPANLLLDEHGQLWVTDFGLARTGLDSGLTMTGDLLGTLRYMSPEQALAKHGLVDHRTDVYSLGVTLYELLTLRPAIDGTDRQEVLQRIATEEPQPPRSLNRAIPADLETVVLKAMAKELSERYATAKEMADDLRRYLEDQPIRAKRPTLWQRVRKWSRRHQPVVWSAAVSLLLILAVVAGTVGWTLNERRERERHEAKEIMRFVDEGWMLKSARRMPEAFALAQHARKVLERTGGQDALRPQVEELLSDLSMIRQLEEIDLRKADVSNSLGIGFTHPAQEYHPVFQNYGIDVLAGDIDDVARMIRDRRIADSLVEAVDNWARMEPDRETRERLLAVAREADPQGVLARWRAAVERRDQPEMRKVLGAVQFDAEPPATLAFLGRSAFQHGLRKEGLELLLAAYALHPGDFWINHDLGYSHALTEPPQLDESLRHYTAALALRPRTHRVYLNIGVVLNRQGKRDAALAAWRKAVDLKPDLAEAHNNIGITLFRAGQREPGEAALLLALSYKPDMASAHNNLGRVYAETKRTKAAFASFEKAIELNPQMSQPYSGRGTLWALENEYDKAVADFHQALKRDDRSVEAYHGLGSVSEQRKQYADAVKWYEIALSHDSRSVPTHYRLGTTYSDWGRQEARAGATRFSTELFDKAIAKFNDTINLDKEYAEAWYSLGNARRDRGQIRAAIAAFQKAAGIKAASDDAEYQPQFNLGNVYARLGEFPRAVEAYNAAIKANPGYARPHISLAAALAELGDFAGSEKAAAVARTLDEQNPEAIANFAVSLDRQGRYAEALAFLRKHREHFKGSVAERHRLEGLMGLYERFVPLQKELPEFLANKKVPANAEDRLMLGEICTATRDFAAAARFYRESFAEYPDVANSLDSGYRFDAARAAACAGRGLDKGAALTPVEEARWRKQALEWLRADLRLWAGNLERGGPLPAPAAVAALQRWRHHGHFVGVRGDAIDKLPPDERDDWRKLWADVDELLARNPVP